MDRTFWQIALMTALVLLSAFFSATETAFSSLNRTRLKSMADRGNKRAAAALRLSERYDDLLSTILVGNNIVNIALASVATVVFVGWIGDAGVSVSTGVITLVVLIFGEVSPKSIAKEIPERMAMLSTPLIHGLMVLLKPINWLFAQWKKLLKSLLRIKQDKSVTQDELLTLVNEAEQEGEMNPEESRLLKSAIEFHDRCVTDILTPRVKVQGIPLDSTQEEVIGLLIQNAHSRLPVFEETLDHIVGILHQKDYFHQLRSGDAVLTDLMKKPVFVPETAKISSVLKLLQKTHSQMAVVADEYGGTIGIITMEDILEELVGEIWDEHEKAEELIRPLGENEYLVQGAAPFELLTQRLNLSDPETEATTLSGWVMEQTQRVPEEGESFTFEGWEVSVLETDGRHVLEAKLKKAAPVYEKEEPVL